MEIGRRMLRHDPDFVSVRDLQGRTYLVETLPLGSWENFIFHFYDADGVEMETFFPKSEDEKEKSGFYILENERKVVFEGEKIRTNFPLHQLLKGK